MSWVIVRKSDGKAVFEVFNKLLTTRVNQTKYKVLPAMEYLVSLNK